MQMKNVEVGKVTFAEPLKRNLPSGDAYGWRSVVEIPAGTYPLIAEIQGGKVDLKIQAGGEIVDNYAPFNGKQCDGLDDMLGKGWTLRFSVTPETLKDPRFDVAFTQGFLDVEYGDFVINAEHPDFKNFLTQGRRQDFQVALGLHGSRSIVSADYNQAFAQMNGYLDEPKLSEGFALGNSFEYMKVIQMDKHLRNYADTSLDDAGVSIADAHAYTKGLDGQIKNIALKATRKLMEDRGIAMNQKAEALDR